MAKGSFFVILRGAMGYGYKNYQNYRNQMRESRESRGSHNRDSQELVRKL